MNNSSASHWRIPLICLGLVFMVFAIYWQTINHGFVNYDDNVLISNNGRINGGLTLENIRWALTAKGSLPDPGAFRFREDTDYWRPVSLISHMLDVQLFGLNAGWHHLVSVGIHALASAALFITLLSLTGKLWRSALVATLFAIHPLHVESVAWLAERKDVLSGLFFILTIGAYTRYARSPNAPFPWVNYILVILCGALAMGSKPMVVTLPFVLLLLDWWPLERIGIDSWKRLLLEKIPLIAMAMAVTWLTTQSEVQKLELLSSLPLSWRLGNAAVSYVTYLCQMIWPSDLVAFYPHPGKDLPLWSIMGSLTLLGAMTWAAIWQRSQRYLAVGWLWYLGMLLPVIGILHSGSQGHADRYTYLPLIGIFIMIAWLAADWVGCIDWRRRLVVVIAAGWITSLGVIAWRQTIFWSNSRILWTHVLDCTRENPVAENNLADTLMDEGKAKDALPHYVAASQFDPSNPMVKYNIALNLIEMGRCREAIEELRQVIPQVPNYPPAHEALGDALYSLGLFGEASMEYQTALKLTPDPQVLYQLGRSLYHDGKRREGIAAIQKAQSIQTESTQIANDLAWMLATAPEDDLRNGQESLVLALQANKSAGGKNPYILDTLAAAYAEIGDFDNALENGRAALKIAEASANKELISSLKKEMALYELGTPLSQK